MIGGQLRCVDAACCVAINIHLDPEWASQTWLACTGDANPDPADGTTCGMSSFDLVALLTAATCWLKAAATVLCPCQPCSFNIMITTKIAAHQRFAVGMPVARDKVTPALI
jgi:hypothetical protein